MGTEPPRLRLLYADGSMLVCDKPSGLLSVPGRGPDKQDCLSARLQALYPDARVVHRLDMATSGLLLMARGAASQRTLGEAFASGAVHKRYEALVRGELPCDAPASWHTIDLPLAPDWPRRPLQRVDTTHGKPSRTRWRCLQSAQGRSRVALEPLTGRSHQLRVHLTAIGHPILGDALYQPETAAELPRLMLHAAVLQLPHPADGRVMRFHSPAPF